MKTLAFSLALSSAAMLIAPITPKPALPPVYKVLTAEYVPTLKVDLVDDTDSQYAVVSVLLSNTTDNLVRVRQVYFCGKSELENFEKQNSYFDPASLNSWETGTFPAYDHSLYLAPKSTYPLRRMIIRKSKDYASDHHPATYLAVKNGEALVAAYSGEVYAAKSYVRGKDYTASLAYVTVASYDADKNQTKIVIDGGRVNGDAVDFDTTFYRYTFAGAEYESPYYSGYDEDNVPWVNGLHHIDDFKNPEINLYKKGSVLQDTTTNYRVNTAAVDYSPYIFIGGLALLALGLVAGLIILAVWVNKKKHQPNKAS
jgi:hypothetical protein